MKSPENKKEKKKTSDKNGKSNESDPKKKKLSGKIDAKKQMLKDKIGKKFVKPDAEKEPLDPEKKAKLKEEKKKLREERRKKDKIDGVFDIGVRAKQVWEEVRKGDCAAGKFFRRNKIFKNT